MTTARKELVDVSVTPWYHCISRCVRAALLMADEQGNDRKQWIEDRLQLLAEHFAIGVAGFAVLDNHLHVLVRLSPKSAQDWTAEEVVRRWMAIYPPADLDSSDERIVQEWVNQQAKDQNRVNQLRPRLTNLGWFMKALKEPLSRLCNRADGVKGTFWEARYKSIAILDEEALLATCAYIDLNPVAAGIATVPEQSDHTSVQQRVRHAANKGQLKVLQAARMSSVVGSQAEGELEQDHWLIPLDDRRGRVTNCEKPVRPGMLASFSLGSYLQLLDFTGRLFREGKARISDSVTDIFERLDTSSEFWSTHLTKMLHCDRLRGHAFALKAE